MILLIQGRPLRALRVHSPSNLFPFPCDSSLYCSISFKWHSSSHCHATYKPPTSALYLMTHSMVSDCLSEKQTCTRTHWQELVWWYSEEEASFSGPSHYLLVLEGKMISISWIKTSQCKMQTVDCKLQTRGKMRTADCRIFSLLYNRDHFSHWELTINRLARALVKLNRVMFRPSELQTFTTICLDNPVYS